MVVAGAKELVVALCNPRLMREFRFLAGLLGLNFSIPSLREKIQPGSKLVVADDECIKSYALGKSSALAVNESNLAKVVFNLSGRSADVLLVGVDPGKRFAYVVISDGVIYSVGYVSSFKELLEITDSLVKKLESKKVIIKVGERGREKAHELIKLINDESYEFYIVGENKTNLRNLYLIGREDIKHNKDFNAALNIALKNGLRISDF